ncbi:hypothetical protein [Salegentibacter salarius]|uniref:Uncharacterized protein n=1 Tax=Salegentibacter salarius TaxID=435906 RepID=A0A2N0TTG9_9FLAO|nr:hypothetical protein [Salegentibacter salarius]OEY72386.1 hypothetical protein BHS39_13450 [Salegentibacter salarius]PKD18042.1 hypothetical protein APR40_13415 [Salegentibacter salarius]SLK03705.1 hypothetical protein SAMN05660445_02752 [Salegentibacter salarius]
MLQSLILKVILVTAAAFIIQEFCTPNLKNFVLQDLDKLSFLIVLMLSLNLNAQINEQPEEERFHLQDIFYNAALSGNIRNFYMNTINRGDLKDYYSNATGATVGLTTGNYYGFQLGAKGSFTYKSFGSDLGREDPVTGKYAKWLPLVLRLNGLLWMMHSVFFITAINPTEKRPTTIIFILLLELGS